MNIGDRMTLKELAASLERKEKKASFIEGLEDGLSRRGLILHGASLGRVRKGGDMLLVWQVTVQHSDGLVWSQNVTLPSGADAYSSDTLRLVSRSPERPLL